MSPGAGTADGPAAGSLPEHLRRVLVVEAGPIAPMENAGDRAVADLLDSLVAIGATVHFHGLGSRGPDDGELLDSIRRRSPMITVTNEDPSIDDLLSDGGFDVVISSRPGPSLAVSSALRDHPGPLRLHWGHDIHSLRLSAQSEVLGTVDDHRTRLMALAERTNWESFDRSVYPALSEAEHVRAMLGDDRGVAFPYFRLTADDLVEPVPPQAGRSGLLMVGLGAHAPNADAAAWMVESILPLIEAQGGPAELTIVGRWEPEQRAVLERRGVVFTGPISDAELRSLHLRHLCLVAPLRFGGGTRRKLVAAMGFGLPIVTTPEGLRGLLVHDAIDGSDGTSAGGDAGTFAAAVCRLAQDPSLWETQAIAGRLAAERAYGATVYDSSLIELFVRSEELRRERR